jgi:hypothetical protein
MIKIEQLHITADKREIKNFSKLPSATSLIRKPLPASVKNDTTTNKRTDK